MPVVGFLLHVVLKSLGVLTKVTGFCLDRVEEWGEPSFTQSLVVLGVF